jgi:hypothetical protein
MLRFTGFFPALFFLLNPLFGQWRAPKYSNDFLSIGAGAAGMAMSGAQTAMVSDVSSGYWNPAGLANQSHKYDFSLMHASYFAGIANYDYAGFSVKVDTASSFAVNFIRLGVDDIPDTRFLIDNGQIDYRRIRSFSSADNALFLSYGRKNVIIPGLSMGGSLKIIYRNAGQFANAWGFGLDAGLQYKFRKWKAGLMLRDITTTFNTWTFNTTEFESVFAQTGNAIPLNSVEITLPSASVGISKTFEFWKNRISLTPAAEALFTFDGPRNTLVSGKPVSIDPRLGLETGFFRMVYVRGSMAGWQKIKNFKNGSDWTYQINFGVGLRFKRLGLDYAITDLGNQAEALYSHVFSIKASF